MPKIIIKEKNRENDSDNHSFSSQSFASSNAQLTTDREAKFAGTWFNKLNWDDDERFQNYGLNREQIHEVRLRDNSSRDVKD